MPIYEYQCNHCVCRFDLKRGFDDDSPAICPQCGSEAGRVFSPVPIIFKGSGFYVTDHKGNNSGSQPIGEDENKTETAKPETVKPEAKAASKKKN